VNVISKDRNAWLKERRAGIGGSDVPAVLGISPYASPYTVWADKLGLIPEKEFTEAMRQGVDLEAYVSRRFCEETGLIAHKKNKILRNPIYPYSLANIDRRIVRERAGKRKSKKLEKNHGSKFSILIHLGMNGTAAASMCKRHFGNSEESKSYQRENLSADRNSFVAYHATFCVPPMIIICS